MVKIFLDSVKIEENEGFDKNDIFERKKFGLSLENIIRNEKRPLVIALDGGWGTGKSTFLRMWRGDLKKKGISSIYFDAFENDYSQDAFLSLASQIIALCDDLKKEKDGKSKEIISNTFEVAKIVARGGIRVGIKAMTAGVLDVGEIQKEIAKEASDIADKYIEKKLSSFENDKSIIEKFKKSLEELPKLCSEKEINMVFIIDELDRCRPNFALEIIEKIKHFFSVPGIHFVLGVNLVHLEGYVKVIYGSSDPELYLQKFINISATIPNKKEKYGDNDILKFIKHEISRHEFSRDDAEYAENCVRFLQIIAKYGQINFREIEKIINHLAIILSATNRKYIRDEAVVMIICILASINRKLYQKAKDKKLSFQDISNQFRLSDVEEDDANYVEYMNNVWDYFTIEKINGDLKSRFDRAFSQFNIGRMNYIDLVIDNYLESLNIYKQ